jgi:RNA polymerase sigma-70 factor (ECF subfamily)
MATRTNDEWLAALRDTGASRNDALADLRVILLNGLRHGLTNWVKTSGPEFSTLSEDFVQDALLKIMDNLDTFQGKSKFTTWAHKITVRVALTELRRKRWKNRSLDEMLSAESAFTFAPASTSPTPERATIQTDLMARVQHIIQEELTDKQRTAMLAGPIGGMPIDVLADEMGMNRNALYKLLHDARKRLKQRLAEEGLTPQEIMRAFE